MVAEASVIAGPLEGPVRTVTHMHGVFLQQKIRRDDPDTAQREFQSRITV